MRIERKALPAEVVRHGDFLVGLDYAYVLASYVDKGMAIITFSVAGKGEAGCIATPLGTLVDVEWVKREGKEER